MRDRLTAPDAQGWGFVERVPETLRHLRAVAADRRRPMSTRARALAAYRRLDVAAEEWGAAEYVQHVGDDDASEQGCHALAERLERTYRETRGAARAARRPGLLLAYRRLPRRRRTCGPRRRPSARRVSRSAGGGSDPDEPEPGEARHLAFLGGRHRRLADCLARLEGIVA
jgi:hypothetical protein